MDTIVSIKPLIAILASLVAVPFIILSGRSPNLREVWTFAAAGLKFVIVASMLPLILAGFQVEFTIAEVLPDFALRLRVDAMGMLFALVSSFLWIVTSLYSTGYMRGLQEHSQTRYFCFFALSLSAKSKSHAASLAIRIPLGCGQLIDHDVCRRLLQNQ